MAKNQVIRSDREWEEIIRQCKTSGMSDQQWCLDHRVPISTFYRRLKQFRNIQLESEVPVVRKPAQEELHAVVPLTIMDTIQDQPEGVSTCHPAASIRFQGITVDLYPGAGSDIIQNLLQMAVELC